MKLDFESNTTTPIITEYSDKGIVIANQNLNTPFIACGEELQIDVLPGEVSELNEQIIEAIMANDVDIIILGTGSEQTFPDAAITLPALQRGVGVEVMETGAACRSYNVLVSEGRKVAGIFYPLGNR
ncbi:MAG: MTH938/NDUFAF3 family protein [Pseudomonadota bacterium]